MERIPCSYDPTDDLRMDLAEAEAEIERLRRALRNAREEFRNPTTSSGYDDDPVVRLVEDALAEQRADLEDAAEAEEFVRRHG